MLMGLSCPNQPHLGPTPTAPASGVSFELGSSSFPEPCWRCLSSALALTLLAAWVDPRPISQVLAATLLLAGSPGWTLE